MRSNKFRWAVVALAIFVVGMFAATAANAANVDWTGLGLDDYWANDANWGDDVAPADGDRAGFNMGGAINVDLNGTPVSLPGSQFWIRNVGPLIVQDLANPANPASITVDVFHIQQYSRPRSQIRVPIIANTEIRSRYRLGGVEFYNQLDTPEMDLGRGDIYMYGDVNATTEFKVVKDDATTNAYLRVHPDTSVVPTLTTPSVIVDDKSSTFYAAGIVDAAAVTLTNGGRYFAETDGSLGDAATNVSVSSGSYLEIKVAQTDLASIDVAAYSVLAGDLTGATYGAGGKVSFVENSVFAPSAGSALPSRADLGGDAILYQGISTSNDNVTVGDNETDAIFKGAANGAWYGSYRANNTQIHAVTDSGNLQVVYAGGGAPQVGNNVRWYGDGTSTTADVRVLNGARLDMQFTVNQDDDYDADATLIDTFNIMGEVGKESVNILYFRESHPHIRAEQTYNVSAGRITGTKHLTGFMPGTLNLSNGSLEMPDDDFTVDDGTLTLSDITVIELPNDTNQDYLENLTDFSYSGTPVVRLNQRTVYSLDYVNNPRMSDLLVNADIAVSGYDGTEISTDMQIGHEKYFVWRFTSVDGTRDYMGIKTSAGAKLKPAGNAPAGVMNVLGIAPNDATLGPNRINVEVEAPGAILRVGSADPDRIASFYNGVLEGTLHAGRVEFRQDVTAEVLETRSGTAIFYTDLTIPTIDIGTDTTLEMMSGITATVTDTLSGNGTVAGGEGIALEDNATFEWAISDPAGEAGTGWDMLFATTLIDFDVNDSDTGKINFSLVDAGMTGTIATTDEFVVAAMQNGEFDLPGEWIFGGGDGWNWTNATLEFREDFADVGGNDDLDDVLVLSGVSFSPAAPMAWLGGTGTWATAEKWDSGEVPSSSGQVTVAIAESYVTVDAPASAASLDVTDGTVDVQSTLGVGGAVTVADGSTLVVDGTLTAASASVAGTLAGGGTINVGVDASVEVTGTVAPGGAGIGTLTLGTGAMELDSAATFNAQVSLATVGPDQVVADQITVSTGSLLMLGGTLAVSGLDDRTDSDSWANATPTVVLNDGDIGEVGVGGYEFTAVTPQPDQDNPPHLGQGAFLRDVIYESRFDPIVDAVKLDLFVALGGDADGDKKVWLSDWAALRANFGNTATDKTWIDGNFDPWVDGKVWLSDWAALRANFGNVDYTVAEAGASAVPEPGTVAMLLAALAGLAVAAWRRR